MPMFMEIINDILSWFPREFSMAVIVTTISYSVKS